MRCAYPPHASHEGSAPVDTSSAAVDVAFCVPMMCYAFRDGRVKEAKSLSALPPPPPQTRHLAVSECNLVPPIQGSTEIFPLAAPLRMASLCVSTRAFVLLWVGLLLWGAHTNQM